MDDRLHRIWPWIAFAVLTVGLTFGVFMLTQYGQVKAPYYETRRRAVIVNDDEAIRREIDEAIDQANRIKERMDKEDGK